MRVQAAPQYPSKVRRVACGRALRQRCVRVLAAQYPPEHQRLRGTPERVCVCTHTRACRCAALC